MKKVSGITSLFLFLAVSLTLLYACSSTSNGDDPVRPAATYSVTVSPVNASGEEAVTPSVSNAEAGTTVTLTAALTTGRRVALSAAGVTITPSAISENGGAASFSMPGADVTVLAEFDDIPIAGAIEAHTANAASFNMRYVPAGGTFLMGELVDDDPVTVTLTNDFLMGETEVTQLLWESVWGATWPGSVPSSSDGLGDNHPAYYVNWYDAAAFCNLLTEADGDISTDEKVYYSNAALTIAYTKADAADKSAVYADWNKKGFRLPTEAEWEYSARYIDGTTWNHGNHVSGDTEYACLAMAGCSHALSSNERISDYAWWSGNNGSYGNPTYGCKAVGQKNANALGLRDMGGNLYEWCYDWKGDYYGGSATNPKGPPNGFYRVYRGGGWGYSAMYLRCAARDGYTPVSRYSYIGFRLCRSAD